MKKQRPDFRDTSSTQEHFYDLREDWPLIEASIAKQYSIRIRSHVDMPWDEFCTLVAGLMPDTPLGQIVTIRAEKDAKTIKSFSPDQKRIHREWQTKVAKKKLENPEKLEKDLNQLIGMFKLMFKKEVKS